MGTEQSNVGIWVVAEKLERPTVVLSSGASRSILATDSIGSQGRRGPSIVLQHSHSMYNKACRVSWEKIDEVRVGGYVSIADIRHWIAPGHDVSHPVPSDDGDADDATSRAERDGAVSHSPRLRRGTAAWLFSVAVHGILLIVVACWTVPESARRAFVTLLPLPQNDLPELQPLPQEFSSQVADHDKIGGGDGEWGGDMGAAPSLAALTELPEMELPEFDVTAIDVTPIAEPIPAAPAFDTSQIVRGTAAVGATGAEGAIDQITDELYQMLQDGPTFVIWLLDRSSSLIPQREAIQLRLDRVYEELGVIEASGSDAFRHDHAKPLLSSVMAFGADAHWMTKNPTDDVGEIRRAIAEIPADESGLERTFTAVAQAANYAKKFRSRSAATRRNVAIMVFTDEAGDDQQELDATVSLCQRLSIPVYVIGVPAPFGREQTMVKWVDPDPRYDQTPQWTPVRQGPETLFPERVQLLFSGEDPGSAAIDSGFGPYALTRLCFESGGIYFAVHPNRRYDRHVQRGETDSYTSFIRVFFDPDVMRRYRPDYLSFASYQREVQQNPMRASLIAAAKQSWVVEMDSPQMRFVKRDEAALAQRLTQAQRVAAKLQPFVDALYEQLQQGSGYRERETVPRWRAGFDLALGRVAAVRVRTDGYNKMLAQAKRGLQFANETNNTWVLRPSTDVQGNSALRRVADEAMSLLQRVEEEHAGTPWAYLAQRERKRPLGWEWEEAYTDIAPAQTRTPNNNMPRNPRDDELDMVEQRPRRDPPRL